MPAPAPSHVPVPHLFMLLTVLLLGGMALVSAATPTAPPEAGSTAAVTSGSPVAVYVLLALVTLGTAVWLTTRRRRPGDRVGDGYTRRDRVTY